MAPTLFKLYACVVAECWLCRMHDVEEWGHTCYISLTSNSSDDTPRMPVKILCTSVSLLMMLHYWPPHVQQQKQLSRHTKAEMFGLRVNISKMKFFIVGHEVQDLEMLPIRVDCGRIECVKEFQYLGSILAADDRIDAEVDKRLLSRHLVPYRRLFSTIPTFLLPPRGVYTKPVCSLCCRMEMSIGFYSGST